MVGAEQRSGFFSLLTLLREGVEKRLSELFLSLDIRKFTFLQNKAIPCLWATGTFVLLLLAVLIVQLHYSSIQVPRLFLVNG